jgi:hypothetical protein
MQRAELVAPGEPAQLRGVGVFDQSMLDLAGQRLERIEVRAVVVAHPAGWFIPVDQVSRRTGRASC